MNPEAGHVAFFDRGTHPATHFQDLDFIADGDAWWVGGRSETLDVDSRPEDTAAPIDIAGLA